MPRKKQLNKLIVEKFVKKESIIWPREMKLANALIEKYPDYKFWSSINFEFKLNSLAWFIGEGKDELFNKWNIYRVDLSCVKNQYVEKIELLSSKLGEDYKSSPSKRKTIKDWLKLW